MSSARKGGSSSGGGGGGGGSRMSSRRSKSPDLLPAQQPGLRRLVQQRMLKDVFETASNKWPGWKILIVDDDAMRVISSTIGMYDIMERKVTLVESLTKSRAPFPDMAAIYFLEPSSASVQRLIQDWSNKSKLLYGDAVFLFFLARLPDSLLDQIKTCKPLLKRLKSLTEINIDFLAKEERAFTFKMPRDVFKSLYLRKSAQPLELVIAEKLVTVCATLNEYPYIRFKQSSAVCNSLATVFYTKMDQFVAQNTSWWYHGGPGKQASQRDRGTLLLLDRADDCLTPLMHDFTYQSMVYDLLPINGDCITYQSETAGDPSQTEAKDVLLDEKDSLWVELRGKHIAAVIETLSARIREITSSATGSTLAKRQTGGNMSLSQMAAALKALPEYREVMSKLSQHMHLSHQCMDCVTQQRLLDLSEVEQTLATGKDDEGRNPKLADLIDRAEHLIMNMKDPMDRLRLILIVTISQGGLRQPDRRRLLDAAGLNRKVLRSLNSLELLGLPVFATSDKNRLSSLFSGNRASAGGQSDDEAEYTSSRYAPAMKGILEELTNDALSMDVYPSVLPMPETGSGSKTPSRAGASSGRGAAGSTATSSARKRETASLRKNAGPSNRWSKSGSGSGDDHRRTTGPTNFSGGRCIVFMVGGLSYGELRSARDVMERESREIILGSTSWGNARDFMEDLASLADDNDRDE